MPPELDPAKLASQSTSPVDESTPALGRAEIRRLVKGLHPDWRLGRDALSRNFQFPTFSAAFGLATRIALLSEANGHHPLLEIEWGRLLVQWKTDAIGDITANDLIMAAKVDRLVARGLGIKDG